MPLLFHMPLQFCFVPYFLLFFKSNLQLDEHKVPYLSPYCLPGHTCEKNIIHES